MVAVMVPQQGRPQRGGQQGGGRRHQQPAPVPQQGHPQDGGAGAAARDGPDRTGQWMAPLPLPWMAATAPVMDSASADLNRSIGVAAPAAIIRISTV